MMMWTKAEVDPREWIEGHERFLGVKSQKNLVIRCDKNQGYRMTSYFKSLYVGW